MLKRNEKGFSLVELMVVLAVVTVLAMLTLPTYRNFILKAEFIETKMAIGAVKVSFEVCVQNLGLGRAKSCRHNSHGIPGESQASEGMVGVKLAGDIYTKTTPLAEDDEVTITATAPTDSRNNGQTYTLTGKLKSGGRIDWDDGQCSKSELC
jgi:prepilin-type N-terminal cleavage/methylation domain-containing protein